MEIINDQHYKLIRRAVLQRPEAVVDVTMTLWNGLASELISIIGVGGFQSLYGRSGHLARETFPWIVTGYVPASAAAGFAGLRFCLEARDCTEAGEASVTLLNIFIDILILLIGEHLTTSILRSAWGDGVVDTAGKELK